MPLRCRDVWRAMGAGALVWFRTKVGPSPAVNREGPAGDCAADRLQLGEAKQRDPARVPGSRSSRAVRDGSRRSCPVETSTPKSEVNPRHRFRSRSRRCSKSRPEAASQASPHPAANAPPAATPRWFPARNRWGWGCRTPHSCFTPSACGGISPRPCWRGRVRARCRPAAR